MSPGNSNPADQTTTPEGGLGHRPLRATGSNSAKQSELEATVVARLEWLDDLMFAAIDGDPVALETAVDAWRKILEELGKDALEESRLQYLRRAQSVWHELRNQPIQPAHKVFAAIEVISLLAGKAW